MHPITPFLMFTGQARQALDLYLSIFPDSKIISATYYEATEPNPGTIKHATFSLNGTELMCIDSPPVHNFTFTPSLSLHVTCQTSEEIENAFEKLSEGGQVLMPLGEYPFSKKYGWLADKFGVSWQLNLVVAE